MSRTGVADLVLAVAAGIKTVSDPVATAIYVIVLAALVGVGYFLMRIESSGSARHIPISASAWFGRKWVWPTVVAGVFAVGLTSSCLAALGVMATVAAVGALDFAMNRTPIRTDDVCWVGTLEPETHRLVRVLELAPDSVDFEVLLRSCNRSIQIHFEDLVRAPAERVTVDRSWWDDVAVKQLVWRHLRENTQTPT